MLKKLRQVKFDDSWPKLKSVIEKIMDLQQISRDEWQDSFFRIHALCMTFAEYFSSSNPYESASKPYEETRKYLKSLVVSHHSAIIHSADFLATYDEHWNIYHKGLSNLNRFLNPINSEYVRVHNSNTECLSFLPESEEKEEILEIYELGLELWKMMLRALSGKLSWFLLEELKSLRYGKCNNPIVLQNVIKSLTQVGVSEAKSKEIYEEIVEKRFLSHTGEYYSMQVDEQIQSGDCSQYMEKVLQWTNDEVLKCNKFLHASSMSKVKSQCLKVMVLDRMEFLLAGFKKLIPLERTKDYQNAYTILKSTENGLDCIASEFEAHITKAGCNIMNGVTDTSPEVFVGTFLHVREKYLNVIKECFDSDKKFAAALEKACTKILKCEHSAFAGRSSEVLAKYCDRILKTNSRAKDGADVEEAMSQAIVVLTYIEDKDIFQNIYAKMLAMRLLRGRTESFHLEESMIAKLKGKCGYEFTKKYEDMFTDMNMKNDLNEKFSGFIKSSGLVLGFDFDAAVLRTSSWPYSAITSSFAIPQVLEKCATEFEKFYRTLFSGRKLSWLHHTSNAEVKLCYLQKPYTVSMSTPQMGVLLLFEQTDTVSFSKMKDSLNLEENYLTKVIQSLTESKLLISAENDVNSGVIYHLNITFSNKRIKFKIPPVARKDQKEDKTEEMKEIHESAKQDRAIIINAAIVRVMKARRTICHNTLIEEVIKQTKHHFVPTTAQIKRCIDRLIDGEFMERNVECLTEYHYIA